MIRGVMKMAKDPICGMEVDEKNAMKTEKDGMTYYFCSQRCHDKFTKEQNDGRKG